MQSVNFNPFSTSDAGIRQEVLRRLGMRFVDAHIVEEMPLHNSQARIDIAVISDSFVGYELKSDADSLSRLPHQIKVYSAVFDKITLVVGYQHAYAACRMVPQWWGIKFAEVGPRGRTSLSTVRLPKQNPEQDALALCRLLRKRELVELLMSLDWARPSNSHTSEEIIRIILENTDLATIKTFVVGRFKRRALQRSGSPHIRGDD